jgi:hypothetical protein
MTVLENIFSGLAEQLREQLRRAQGPPKWCKRCSRNHPRGVPCDTVTVALVAKSGRMVSRQVHRSRMSD